LLKPETLLGLRGSNIDLRVGIAGRAAVIADILLFSRAHGVVKRLAEDLVRLEPVLLSQSAITAALLIVEPFHTSNRLTHRLDEARADLGRQALALG
jgi:hypothetical protein